MDDATLPYRSCPHFEANSAGRDFVVGDIHGHTELLVRALDAVNLDPACDRVFSVGDLVDRGPDSPRALAYVDQPWFHSVMGNHEQLLIHGGQAHWQGDHYAHHYRVWMANGGAWFADLDEPAQKTAVERARRLPSALSVDIGEALPAVVVHADIHQRNWGSHRHALANGSALDRSRLITEAAWSPALLKDTLFPPEKDQPMIAGAAAVFVGHNVVAKPRATSNVRMIDTGSFQAQGSLTIAELATDGAYISIPRSSRVQTVVGDWARAA